MTRGERERWNKLSADAKAVARVLAQYADAGKVRINDLRLHSEMKGVSSRGLVQVLKELESRDYGRLDGGDGADPAFVLNVPALQTLAQSRRLTNQAPHGLSQENGTHG